MPWVSDSRFKGYIGPQPSPAPTPLDSDGPWTDFLQEMVVGITDLGPTLVRPRWQTKPPLIPEPDVDWASVGIGSTVADWQPAIIHVPDGDGYDAFQRHETTTLLCSFYGNNAQFYAALLRDGLFIDQNLAILRANAVGLVEVGALASTGDLYRMQFRGRVDMEVVLRREIRRNYSIFNLLRSEGTIDTETFTTDFDTGP